MSQLDEVQLEIAVCDWLKAQPFGRKHLHEREIVPVGDLASGRTDVTSCCAKGCRETVLQPMAISV